VIAIHPQRIPGRWREGYALDIHTEGSTFLGHDEFGRPRFDTRRSESGDLLYRLKYQGDQTAVVDLVEAASAFIHSTGTDADTLVPIPPSRARAVQPVLVLGEALAKALGIDFCPNGVRRRREVSQLKDVFDYDQRWRLLADLHEVDRPGVEGKRILLFDDLFRSGATMNSVAATLYEQGGVADIFALTVTRTRSKQ
jgi:predicted amidophosphoribosyltransferase